MKRSASAVWQGDLKGGKGTVSTASGALSNLAYSFSMRFEDAPGTNPEELVAAAHAGCFAMALSATLGKAGFTPERLAAEATASLEQVEGSWTVTTVHLKLAARVPGLEPDRFQALAADAKANCPISRLLKADITLEASLE